MAVPNPNPYVKKLNKNMFHIFHVTAKTIYVLVHSLRLIVTTHNYIYDQEILLCPPRS